MKAVVVTESGLMIQDVAMPEVGPDQVLVKVKACGLNRADLAVVSGGKYGSQGGPGTVPGLEFSGDVVGVGANVKSFKPGDKVMCSGAAAFAEYAVTDYGRAMPIPAQSMSYEQAVTLPIAIQTMHDAIVTNGQLKATDTVLVQGASTGVGLMALQIAKLLGAKRVIGTSTTAWRRDQLAKFGADVALDSSDPAWPELAKQANDGNGIDLIIDQLSGAVANQNLEAMAVLGRIVNVGRLAGSQGDFNFDLHALKRIKYIGVTFRTRSAQEIREITRLAVADLWPHLQSGKLALPIDQVFSFDQSAQAYAHMRANKHFGKIVVRL